MINRNYSVKYIIIFLNLVLVIEKLVCLEIIDLTSDSFQERCLQYHNVLRARHCVLPLHTDDNVVKVAKERAKNLAEGIGKNFGHTSSRQLITGENIIWSKAKKPPNCQTLINLWYKEVDNYQWNKPGDKSNGVIGHFTQIVWRETTSIGCAMFQTKDAINHYFTVCCYHPKGNVDRSWNQNVFQPSLCGQRLITTEKKLNNSENSEQDVILQASRKEDVMLFEAIVRPDKYDNDTILKNANINLEKWGPDKCDGRKYRCRLKEPIDKFNDDCLKAHNVLRVKHKVPSLIISQKLIEMAKRRVISMAGQNKNIYHTADNPYGENLHQLLASPKAKEVDCDTAVNSFYKEIDNYDFNTGKSKNRKPVGHFAQTVWKATKEVGCVEALYIGNDRFKRTIVVCEYEPFGNIKSLFVKNVFKHD